MGEIRKSGLDLFMTMKESPFSTRFAYFVILLRSSFRFTKFFIDVLGKFNKTFSK